LNGAPEQAGAFWNYVRRMSLTGLSVDDVLTTTRSVRKRLDFDRPVARDVVEECVRLAFQAPNGSNQQGWGWVFVDDPSTRRVMADLYRQGLQDHQKRDRTGEIEPDRSLPTQQRISASVAYLLEHMQDVPVLLVPVIAQRYGDRTTFQQASKWGSLLPAVWSFMLALRIRGLAGAWTTLSLYREAEMAQLLGIPHGEWTQGGLFPVAYTVGTEFHAADRRASESRIFWNRWAAR
jgi:nitroreductase